MSSKLRPPIKFGPKKGPHPSRVEIICKYKIETYKKILNTWHAIHKCISREYYSSPTDDTYGLGLQVGCEVDPIKEADLTRILNLFYLVEFTPFNTKYGFVTLSAQLDSFHLNIFTPHHSVETLKNFLNVKQPTEIIFG